MSLDIVKKRTSSNIFGKDLWGLGIHGYGLYNRVFNFDNFYDIEDKKKQDVWISKIEESTGMKREEYDSWILDRAWEMEKEDMWAGPYLLTKNDGIMQTRVAPLLYDDFWRYYREPMNHSFGKSKTTKRVEEEIQEKETKKVKKVTPNDTPNGSRGGSPVPHTPVSPIGSRESTAELPTPTAPLTPTSPIDNDVENIDKVAEKSGLGNITLRRFTFGGFTTDLGDGFGKTFSSLFTGASGDGLSETIDNNIITSREDLDPTSRTKVETETSKGAGSKWITDIITREKEPTVDENGLVTAPKDDEKDGDTEEEEDDDVEDESSSGSDEIIDETSGGDETDEEEDRVKQQIKDKDEETRKLLDVEKNQKSKDEDESEEEDGFDT